MKKHYLFWGLMLVVSLVVNGLTLRLMALAGVRADQSLVIRGVVCLLLVVAFANRTRLSLWPKAPRTQILRALLAGLALSFFTFSYQWLTASAVSVLSNIDVPLLIVLGPVVGVQASLRTRGLALFSISFLMIYVANLEPQPHLSLGLSFLALGTFLLCFGYLFIQKSMHDENQAITILTPSLAIIFYGIVQGYFAEPATLTWTPQLGVAGFLAGASMFGAYYATMKLYAVTDLATAEFPTLVASIVIQPFEAHYLDSSLQPAYLVSAVGFVLFTYFVLSIQKQDLVASRA